MIKLLVSHLSVEEKIQCIVDDVARVRCMNAYQFLINSADSGYPYFILLRNRLSNEDKQLNVLNINETIGIECTLWPDLYPRTDWCESAICEADPRQQQEVLSN